MIQTLINNLNLMEENCIPNGKHSVFHMKNFNPTYEKSLYRYVFNFCLDVSNFKNNLNKLEQNLSERNIFSDYAKVKKYVG